MPSPTQRLLTPAVVAAAARRAFGTGTAHAQPLDGGSYGSVWRLRLDDGRDVVLKAAPEPGTPLLRYETGLLAAEAEYLRLAHPIPGVPAAELLYVDDEFLFMTALPGVRLYELAEDHDRVREQCGAAVARLHGVSGSFFGYSGERPRAATWPQAYALMIDALLDDADRWGVRLPVAAAEIRACVADGEDALATVATPSLLHFDLWDGNVLAASGGQHRGDGNVLAASGADLTGLVDGERYLFGDPMVDFASPALFTDMLAARDEHPFLRGYRTVRPLEIDETVRRRLWYGMLYLYLVMVVEFPSRGMSPAEHPDRWARQCDLVEGLVGRLRRGPAASHGGPAR